MAGIACLGIYKTDLEGNGRSQLVEDAVRCNGRFVFLFQAALALAPYIRARCPGAIIIGRPTWFPDDAAQIAMGPEAAKAWARQMLAEHPECDVYQYVCEQIPGARPDSEDEKQEQYCRLAAQVDAEIAAADVFHAAGKGLVAINVAPGIIPMEEHPDQLRVWREYLGRLFAHPGVRYYGIHSYGTPDDISPGCKGRMQTDWGTARWYALRFQSHLAGLARLGLQPPAIIHTEYGQTDGWKGIISEDEAAADFRWFLDINQREPRVAGCVMFLHGDHDPEKWHPFDTQGSGILDTFADWNAAHPMETLPRPVTEGGTMTQPQGAPTGVGWWIWYLDKALNGRTPEEFAGVCKEHSITHLFIKTSDGADFDGWKANQDGIAALRAAGLRVYSWSYHYGDDPQHEAEAVNEALRLGVDGHVLDIEAECEGKRAAIEWEWQIIRTAFPNAWVGYAPLPIIDYHDPALYAVSNRYTSAVLPQFYTDALGDKYNLRYLFQLWESWKDTWDQGKSMPQLMPIGQAYDTTTPETIKTFVQMCKGRHIPACSFWEWTASTDDQWDAVATAASEWTQAEQPAPTEPVTDWEAAYKALVGEIKALAGRL